MTLPARWGGRHQPAQFPMEDWFHPFGRWLERAGSELSAGWTPPADLEETENNYVVHAELPGIRRDDLSVELDDRELEIHGETPEPERSGTVRQHTRRTGTFNYRIRLPGNVDADNVTAGLSDGVLTVTLPKTTQTKGRRIEISES